jgi:hypothetical protein
MQSFKKKIGLCAGKFLGFTKLFEFEKKSSHLMVFSVSILVFSPKNLNHAFMVV